MQSPPRADRAAADPPTGRSRPSAVTAALVAAVLLPLAALAVGVLRQRHGIALSGDQAVIELGTREAEHADVTLGPYSRYGWSHPGPFWYYLLAGPYRLLGSSSAALYLAVLAVHALFAGLVVGLSARLAGRAAAAGAAAGILLLYAVLGAEVFHSIWNPYALLLPLLLLIVLASRAATGSLAALAGAVLVASFLAQTHVGAAVPAAALCGAAVLIGVPMWWRRRTRGGRRDLLAAGGLLLAAALSWLPPAVQELRPGTGNLSLLRDYVQQPNPGHLAREGVAAVGSSILQVPTLGHATALPGALTDLDPPELAAVLGLVVACLLVAVVAAARRLALPAALAGMTLVAGAASVYAVTRADAVVYPYLVQWQVILPLPLLIAVGALLARPRRRPAHLAPADRPRAAAGVPALLLAGSLVAGVGCAGYLASAAPPLRQGDRADVAPAVRELLPALGTPTAGAVRVRIASGGSWPLAAGLVLALSRRGYDTRVTPDWTFMFGADRGSTGAESREVVLVQQPELAYAAGSPGARVLGPVTNGTETSYVVLRTAGGRPVPGLPGPVTGKVLRP